MVIILLAQQAEYPVTPGSLQVNEAIRMLHKAGGRAISGATVQKRSSFISDGCIGADHVKSVELLVDVDAIDLSFKP